jgi:two-component system chemotaxis sensor kinase CheA
MFPFSEACQGLERTVRDLAAKGEKKIELTVEGGDIELDRLVLESIRDPLLHLVRNAVDHGIEPAAQRRAAGKAEIGRIVITAALRGGRVEIQVKDDGRGLDRNAIAGKLRAGGQAVPEDARELALSIFAPGFSTAAAVTEVSGRGVGLDIVKTQLAAMRGTVAVAAAPAPGSGTVFTLDVPLTLTSVRAVLAVIGDQRYAVDTSSVERVIRIAPSEIRPIGERETVSFAGVPVPVVTLAEALGLPERPLPEAEKTPALVLSIGDRRVALAVDSVDAEREVVVRALGPRLKRLPGIAGGTILADGTIALILNVADLIDRALELPGKVRLAAAATDADAVRKRLLVVDDSATIRTLEKSILEAAGYDVMIAVDGEEALQILLERGADLVVSDVEMPRMDGFSLTEAIRASKRFRDLPVVLVTAMESDADKARGMAAGANAYRPKSAFDQQDLIATIQRIL